MHATNPPDAPHGTPGDGYERSDLSPKVIALSGIGLTVIVVLAMLAATWMFTRFASRESGEGPAAPAPRLRSGPPEPRLQVDPPRDLRAFRATEDAILRSYAWVDRETGRVRIPIERAMELLLERGLPHSGGAGAATEGRR